MSTTLPHPTPPDAQPGTQPDDAAYLSSQIITCIGNKRALLPGIEAGITRAKAALGKERIVFLDAFSGTGIVSRMAKRHASHIHANDLEAYSAAANRCYLSNASDVDHNALAAHLRELEAYIEAHWAPGFLTELYCPADEERIRPGERVFYTRRNGIYLDTARRCIDTLPEDARPLLLGPLLAAASVHANTGGVFKGFYKNQDGIGQYGGSGRQALARILADIRAALPVLSPHECTSTVHQQDANTLVADIDDADVAYLDPPYNQHPYGSNYFMLNLLCDYRRPTEVSRVSGIPTGWNRSAYNRRRQAADALFDCIARCRAPIVLVSYNSEGFIPHERFLKELGGLGRLSVVDTRYNAYRGSRNLHARDKHVTEFLYSLDRR